MKQTASNTSIFSDDHYAYRNLPNHAMVKHSVGEYVRGQVHTHGIGSDVTDTMTTRSTSPSAKPYIFFVEIEADASVGLYPKGPICRFLRVPQKMYA